MRRTLKREGPTAAVDPSMDQIRPWQTALALALLAGAIAVFFYRTISDPDVLMHLRTGQLIGFTGRIPMHDPFSASAAGAQWITHEWLWQVITWQLYRAADWAALYGLRYACVAAAIVACLFNCRLHRVSLFAGSIACLLATGPLATFSEIRPQMISYALFAGILWILSYATRRPRILLLLPPLFLLWANVHGAFLLGIVACSLTLIAWLIEARRHPSNAPLPMRMLIMTTVIAGLAALINPHTLHIYLFPLKVLGEGLFRSSIYEWTPPDSSLPFGPFWCLLAAATLAAIFVRKQLRLKDWLLLLAFGIAAVRARRQIPFFALTAVPVISMAIQQLLLSTSADFIQRLKAPAAIVAALLFLAGTNAATSRALPAYGYGLAPERFPDTATYKLASFSADGSVLNDYNDGGFLIWRLYPDWPVIMDGRADVYGGAIVQKYQDVWAGKPGWQQQLDQWNVQAILGRYEITSAFPKHNLYHELARSHDWALVYWDDLSVLYLRRGGALNSSRMKPYRRLHPGLRWPEIAALQQTEDDWIAFGADIRKALSEDRNNQRAKRLEQFYLKEKR